MDDKVERLLSNGFKSRYRRNTLLRRYSTVGNSVLNFDFKIFRFVFISRNMIKI